MAVLFLSHSSKDDAAATAPEAWLHGRGFTDTFIDHDGDVGLLPGTDQRSCVPRDYSETSEPAPRRGVAARRLEDP